MLRADNGLDDVPIASAYFFNKDGHDGDNRCRDYLLQVRVGDERDVYASRLLAQARVREFWGGVHKRFIVSGPATYLVKVRRNHSLNAIISAVFVDRISGPADRYELLPLPFMGGERYCGDYVTVRQGSRDAQAAVDCWLQMSEEQASMPHVRQRQVWLQLYRHALYAGVDPATLSGWRWSLTLWDREDRKRFSEAMDRAWNGQVKLTAPMQWEERGSLTRLKEK